MSERESIVTREEFQRLAHRVENIETLLREGVRPRVRGRAAEGQRETDSVEHVVIPPPVIYPMPSASPTGSKETSSPSPEITDERGYVASNPSPPPSSPVSPAPATPELPLWDLEQLIGKQLLPKVAAFIFILGVAFFLKYAFNRGWISPELRIGMGVAVGATFVLFGEASHRKAMRPYGDALTAIGLVTSYLSIYAGAALYGLFDTTTTVGLFALISGLGAFLSVRYDAQFLAVMAAVGAYMGPMLVSGGSSGEPSLTFLSYMAAVSGGLAALSFFKGWRAVQGLAFVATWLLSWETMGDFADGGKVTLALGFATIFYAEFLLASVALRFRENAGEREGTDLFLLLANPFLYYLAVRDFLDPIAYRTDQWLTALAFALAILYGALMEAAPRRDDSLTRGAASAVSAAFLTTGFALGFPQWATLAWCAEAMALLWAGYTRDNGVLRTAARIVLGFALMRLLFHDLPDEFDASYTPFLNPRFLTLSLVSATLLAFGWMHRRYGDREAQVSFLAAWTGAVMLLGLGMVFESPIYASLLWMGLALLWLTTTHAAPVTARNGFFALMIAAIVLRVLAMDVKTNDLMAGADPFLNLRFFTLLALTGLLAYSGVLLAPGKNEEEKKAGDELRLFHLLLLGANLCLLFALSLEVLLVVNRWVGGGESGIRESVRQFALSALWAAYASALIVWGFFRQETAVRIGGLGLLGVVVGKLLFVDLAHVETGWRIASFIGTGALLLAISLAYNRRERHEADTSASAGEMPNHGESPSEPAEKKG